MQISGLFTKINKVLNFKLAAASLVVVAAVFFYIIWSVQPRTSAKIYLPADTVSYINWSDKQYFEDQTLSTWGLIDKDALDRKKNNIKDLLGKKFDQVQQTIVFSSQNASNSESILLSVSGSSSRFIKQITNIWPNYTLVQLDRHTILLSGQSDLATKLEAKKYSDDNSDTGLEVFWQNGFKPDYIKTDNQFFNQQSIGPQVYIDYYKDQGTKKYILSVYGNKQQTVSAVWQDFSGAQVPNDAEQTTILQSSSVDSLANSLRYIISSVYERAPEAQLVANALLQYKNGWLLVGSEDWKAVAQSMSSSFKLEEKQKTLPDGTKYTEYVSTDDLNTVDHQYLDKNYWQLDKFFGVEYDGYYYLTDSEQIIEEILSGSTKPLSENLDGCINADEQAGDWLVWDESRIVSEEIKKIFKDHGLDKLIGLSFTSGQHQGFRACF